MAFEPMPPGTIAAKSTAGSPGFVSMSFFLCSLYTQASSLVLLLAPASLLLPLVWNNADVDLESNVRLVIGFEEGNGCNNPLAVSVKVNWKSIVTIKSVDAFRSFGTVAIGSIEQHPAFGGWSLPRLRLPRRSGFID
jgi:hypothetical protein